MQKWQLRIFILCWVAYAAIYFGRVNLSVAIPALETTFGWSKSQIGLIGTTFFWVYGTGQLINGYLGDKFPSRVFVFLGLLVASATNILFGFSSTLWLMAILWATNGYFQSMLWGPIVKTLSHWFSHEKRSQTMVAISTSMVGGYLLAWGLSGQIIARTHWRWAFWAPGLSLLAFSLVWFMGIRNRPEDVGLPSPNPPLPQSSEARPSLSLLQVIYQSKLWPVIIACFAQGIIKDGIGLWGPTLFLETHQLTIATTTRLILIIPFMNFAGMMLAGWLNKRLQQQEKRTVTILLAGCGLMILGLVTLEGLYPLVGLALLGGASALAFGANTLLLGVIPLHFAQYNRVSSIAGFLDFCSYLAAGFAALFTGLVVGPWGWQGVLFMWIVVCMIGVGALLIDHQSLRGFTESSTPRP